MTPVWADFFKIFTYQFTPDPYSRRANTRDLTGAGVTQPDAIPMMGPDGSMQGGGDSRLVRFRDTNEMIDLSSVSNRQSRYKEYQRLLGVPEIDRALTVFADEACLAGWTKVQTPHGEFTIEQLAKTRANDRFLVYSYDEEKGDYTLGWAFAPRKTKTAKTICLVFDNGKTLTLTHDHRIMKRDGKYVQAGEAKIGDVFMPFYRLRPNPELNKLRTGQQPRIRTFLKGWVNERQFVDDWKLGRTQEHYEKANEIARMATDGLVMEQILQRVPHDWKTIKLRLAKAGFTYKELKKLGQKEDCRRIVDIRPGPEIDVYDMSVEKYKNFCTDSIVVHNCQKDEFGNIFKIECGNMEVQDELKHFFFHRQALNMNRRGWTEFRKLCLMGDLMWEAIINPERPSDGISNFASLPPESMYRIETTKGKLIEFQQAREGPDYNALVRAPIMQATDAEIAQSTAIRFAPEQIVHIRIGDDRKTFYPYGVSLVEPARGPAHQLRLMEDAMLVYRLSRAPERRIFYIDVGQLPPFKAEAFVERLKDQFRKKKVATNRSPYQGANQVEERWHAPAVDEDYWLPMRKDSQTKIDTLPGAQNLGEIDDAVYFRNKLFVALNFPPNYLSNEDPNATRITLSSQDVKFARIIERLQGHFEDGLWEMADRHLQMLGYPPDVYDDLTIKMTPPSDWRELSRAETTNNRVTTASSLKSAQLMSDYDVHIRYLRHSEEETQEMIARLKIQKLEELKLQVLAQNPQLLGVGTPGQQGQDGQEIGSQAGGPNPMLGGDPAAGGAPGGAPPAPGLAAEEPPEGGPGNATPEAGQAQGVPLSEPEEEDILKYDLEIQDYDAEQDVEDIDYSVNDD